MNLDNIEKELDIINEENSYNSSPDTSPLRLPTLTPAKINNRDKIKPLCEKDNIYDEDQTEIEVPENMVSPHTPVRIQIETPKSPKVNYKELPDLVENYSLYDKLKEYRYTLIKYIIDQNEKIPYIVAFDPNGQIVFVKIDDDNKIYPEDNKIISVVKLEHDSEDNSFQSGIKEKITHELSGIVFFDSKQYIFSLRQDNGEYKDTYYNIKYIVGERKTLFQVFTVINIKDIMNDKIEINRITRINYQIIQQQQIYNNKIILKNLYDNIDKLYNDLENYNNNYTNYSNNIIEDWSLLSVFSKKYYQKYKNGKLMDTEKNKYDTISVNLFSRFQSFNSLIDIVNQMKEITGEINKISQFIKEKSDAIKKENKNTSGKLIKEDQVKILI